MKFTTIIILLLSTLLLSGCVYKKNDNPITTEPTDNTLTFTHQTVRIEKDENNFDQVYILNTDTNNKTILAKPEVLQHRPIFGLTKTSDHIFSYFISATPHYGHRFDYDLNTNQAKMQAVGDECYFLSNSPNNFPEELKTKAEQKCTDNPEFDTLENHTKNLSFE
ncbi:hypothetical protein COT97_02640 [Candidatus Falkowbacteria bacterium CG10_big_fil_rev_8_21_14_0_10_39_11]|uniref:Lipoprotein n=1 Tax=Candidatus Falkowbacteria bacterium CG10_big_fil_rev_8_21_14_0_10_39_11 TaxID=1974565 RepID=A0A2H0V520_9BACT|nr:MAG: hypothetical protein COT97_02640 [Candidatus Falkowbacteria bacterium CG10_big_fil_rev_8_21_14_0_10_39_11]